MPSITFSLEQCIGKTLMMCVKCVVQNVWSTFRKCWNVIKWAQGQASAADYGSRGYIVFFGIFILSSINMTFWGCVWFTLRYIHLYVTSSGDWLQCQTRRCSSFMGGPTMFLCSRIVDSMERWGGFLLRGLIDIVRSVSGLAQMGIKSLTLSASAHPS